MVTNEPTVATGRPAGPTLTVGAPIAVTPGGGGNPLIDSGIPTQAIGTGILSDYSAFGWLNTCGSTDIVIFNICNYGTMHDNMLRFQRYISIYIRRN